MEEAREGGALGSRIWELRELELVAVAEERPFLVVDSPAEASGASPLPVSMELLLLVGLGGMLGGRGVVLFIPPEAKAPRAPSTEEVEVLWSNSLVAEAAGDFSEDEGGMPSAEERLFCRSIFLASSAMVGAGLSSRMALGEDAEPSGDCCIWERICTVSYTHLTLPTIYSV